MFQFLLTQAQEYNDEMIKFTSVNYERYMMTLKGGNNKSEEVDKECDNELINIMSYFDVTVTKISN